MNKKEQAEIILEQLREYFQIGYDCIEEELYTKAIIEGLIAIEKRDQDEIRTVG